MDEIETTLGWYNRESAGWAKYYSTRFLLPYLSSVTMLTLISIFYRNFMWFLGWASIVGCIAFFIGFMVALGGIMNMNVHDGPRDSIGMIIGGIIIILAAILVVLAIVSFSSIILSLAILDLEPPPGW